MRRTVGEDGAKQLWLAAATAFYCPAEQANVGFARSQADLLAEFPRQLVPCQGMQIACIGAPIDHSGHRGTDRPGQ